ncbi:MAG: hypothetical protein LBD32_02380 [Cytophagales bacterium]|jgi:hypothetical protein|nr:hypothetical protein [Cytophagales bacterium]
MLRLILKHCKKIAKDKVLLTFSSILKNKNFDIGNFENIPVLEQKN